MIDKHPAHGLPAIIVTLLILLSLAATPAAAEDAVLLPPRNLQVTVDGDEAVLTWDSPLEGNVSSYTVYRLENGSRQMLGAVGPSTTSFTAPWSNQTMAYWVTAKDSDSESAPAIVSGYPHCWIQPPEIPELSCFWPPPFPPCPVLLTEGCDKAKSIVIMLVIRD